MDDASNGISEPAREAIGRTVQRIPNGLFVMTAAHEHRMHGVVIRYVQRVSVEPPLILVALPKGQTIVPLIHDSRAFAICQIAADDRFTLRKFSSEDGVDEESLHGVDIQRRATGSPILARCQSFLDCDLVRHADIDGDHDIYVGLVREGDLLTGGDVAVETGESEEPTE